MTATATATPISVDDDVFICEVCERAMPYDQCPNAPWSCLDCCPCSLHSDDAADDATAYNTLDDALSALVAFHWEQWSQGLIADEAYGEIVSAAGRARRWLNQTQQ